MLFFFRLTWCLVARCQVCQFVSQMLCNNKKKNNKRRFGSVLIEIDISKLRNIDSIIKTVGKLSV